MIGIDISTLSQGELERLSQAARARGQTALADAVTHEIRTRPMRSPASRPKTIAQPAPEPPAVAPIVPLRIRPVAPTRRRLVSRWALSGVALVALVIGWGVTLPSSYILEVEFDPAPALALIEAPVSQALCAAATVIGGREDCAAPPLADLMPAVEPRPSH